MTERLNKAAAKGMMSCLQTGDFSLVTPGANAAVLIVFRTAVDAVEFQDAYVANKLESEK